MITLYLFDVAAAQHLVHAKALYHQKDVTRETNWIKTYEEENGRKLIRAVLGVNELTVLKEGDEIILPAELPKAKGCV
jgi:hypothetical protein